MRFVWTFFLCSRMTVIDRGPLDRMEAAFAAGRARFWDVVAPYALITLAVSFLRSVAAPMLASGIAEAVSALLLAIIGILLSAAFSVGAYFEILRPSAPAPMSFSMDVVARFCEISWRELGKQLRTFYYVFEYAYLVPVLAMLGLVVVAASFDAGGLIGDVVKGNPPS